MDPALLALFRRAYATGWLVAAPIGPVNLEIIRRSLRYRLAAGFLVGCGACCVDAAYLILFSAGLGEILRYPGVRAAAFLAGGALLTWLGALALRDARRFARGGAVDPVAASAAASPGASATEAFLGAEAGAGAKTISLRRCYLVGVGMCATNPMTIAFWSALALSFVGLPVGWRVGASAAVLLGAFSWVTALTLILAAARRWVGPALFTIVNLLGGLALVYFGLGFLWRGALMEALLLRWFSGG